MPVQEVVAPDSVFVQDGEQHLIPARRDGDRWSAAGVRVEVTPQAQVRVAGSEVHRIALRWRQPRPAHTLVLGDAWERSYGDLQWQGLRPERVLPWYWLAHDPATGATHGMGVQVRPRAFCSWTVDAGGVTLWLDLGNGGGPTQPGDREILATTIHAVTGDDPWNTANELCAVLCPEPPLTTEPVVGCNNWYYAYGAGFDHDVVIGDARTIVELCGDHPVRPFSVVDAGWSPGGGAPGGPWNAGTPGKFDDMAATAAAIAATGARPGIWFRPLLSQVDTPLRRVELDGCWALDPSRAGTLEQVAADIHRIRDWGFELIKHDFSTYDLFGRFAPAMGGRPAAPGPNLADPGRTNAEVILDFYETVKEASGSALVIGCNTVGHLAAGLVEIQRIGDDTSGRQWDRTRRMGVNTLAFRLPQHGRFFVADADCVPCTPATDWTLNRQFLDVVARSGTALFVSVDPRSRTPEIDADLSAGLRTALDGGDPGEIRPLDWMHSPTPSSWRFGDQERSYDWLEAWGADPLTG
ncbi:MAG TPA: hypothetical protein VHC49_26785 [Mycobacteriales bacterium]|nr:hypothetical protein [Mycobacteriales bacterium]